MNKHVPQPPLSGDEAKSANKTASAIRGGEADVKEVPPPKPAQAKSPSPQQAPARPQTDKVDEARAEKPQADQPQADRQQTDKQQAHNAQPDKQRKRDRIARAAILVALIVGALLWWSRGGGGSRTAYVFSKASYGTVTLSVRAAGILAAHDSLDITAPVGGRVQSVLAKSGDRVMKGQVLAELQSDSARDELLRAQTEFAAMRARGDQADADITEARAALLRAKSDPKPGAYDGAQADLARSTARASELQAQLREAVVQMAAARALVDSLTVRAPFDGIVLKSDIEPGKYVSAAAGGRALFTLATGLSQLNLVVDIPEAQLGTVRAGEPVRFTVPAFPKGDFPAILTALDLWPKKETKDDKDIISYPATISADNPDGVLRPGMSANAAIIIAEARNALVVPNQALIFSPPPDVEAKYPKPKTSPAPGQRLGRVWILDGDTPEPRDIALGLTDGRITQVVAGPLRAGEKIITSAIH